jgi:hypothetical protein
VRELLARSLNRLIRSILPHEDTENNLTKLRAALSTLEKLGFEDNAMTISGKIGKEAHETDDQDGNENNYEV